MQQTEMRKIRWMRHYCPVQEETAMSELFESPVITEMQEA